MGSVRGAYRDWLFRLRALGLPVTLQTQKRKEGRWAAQWSIGLGLLFLGLALLFYFVPSLSETWVPPYQREDPSMIYGFGGVFGSVLFLAVLGLWLLIYGCLKYDSALTED